VGGNTTITLQGSITISNDVVLANWYPFQENPISLSFVSYLNASLNTTLDASSYSSAGCTNGGLSLTKATGEMILTLKTLKALKIRWFATGGRTLQVVYGPTGTENTWNSPSQYSSGGYEHDLGAMISGMVSSSSPIIVRIINNRSDGGTLHITDLYLEGSVNISNSNPAVSITSPASNSSYCQGTSVTITANATDTDGTISKVELFDGSNLLVSLTSSPYTYVWANASTGTHTITAKATDDKGGQTTSTAITTTINNIPAVPSVNSPVTYNQGASATALTATGSNLKWYNTETGGTSSGSAPIPSTNSVGTTNYYVSQSVSNCESNRANIVVNVIIPTYTQTITLNSGLNLISFNVVPANTSIEAVFASVLDNIAYIKTSDVFWKSDQSEIFNSLKQIKNGEAYLINMKSGSSLSVTGPAVPLPLTISIKKGLNMIGVPSQSSVSIQTLVNGKPIEYIKNFQGAWFLNGSSGITTLEPGKGYYIKASETTSIGF